MLYAIMADDVEESSTMRAATRHLHVDYLRRLVEAGKLVVAGPHPAIDSEDPGPAGFTGSLIVAEFESLDAARDWATQDPYAVEGVFRGVIVKPLLETLS